MIVFNILFQFGNTTHIANVSYASGSDRYIIYFTDVELILAFGNKAEYDRQSGVRLLRQGKGSDDLTTAIARELQVHIQAA